VDRHAELLAASPTWLFRSGPIGDPPRPSEQEAVQIIAATQAWERCVFAGKLDKSRLSFPERAVVFAFRVAEGDFRDWDAIAVWASDIADALETRAAGGERPAAA